MAATCATNVTRGVAACQGPNQRRTHHRSGAGGCTHLHAAILVVHHDPLVARVAEHGARGQRHRQTVLCICIVLQCMVADGVSAAAASAALQAHDGVLAASTTLVCETQCQHPTPRHVSRRRKSTRPPVRAVNIHRRYQHIGVGSGSTAAQQGHQRVTRSRTDTKKKMLANKKTPRESHRNANARCRASHPPSHRRAHHATAS